MPLNIALVEDNARYARSLARMLSAADMPVVAHFSRASEVQALLANPTSDISWQMLLLDIGLPDQSGISLIAQIKSRFPDRRIIMLTSLDQPATIVRAISQGADGYLLKLADPQAICEQIMQIEHGAPPLSASVAERLFEVFRGAKAGTIDAERLPLSERECEVLDALRAGFSYKEIARELDIALDTVRNHIRKIYQKLNVTSARAAIAKAAEW
jgi:DNA-binding NarL/FixJ family response regulator